MPKSRSLIDPRRTVDPKTGRKICGAYKTGKPQELKARGLTLEMILADQNLFNEFICKNKPGHQNGRCCWHGGNSTGRNDYRNNAIQQTGEFGILKDSRLTGGKYRQFFPTITEEELAALKTEHKDLSDELMILVRFIKEQLPTALNDNSSPLYLQGSLRDKILGLRDAFTKMDATKIKKYLDDLVETAESSKQLEEAQKRVRMLIREYSDIFEVEIKRRALSGEYISKKEYTLAQSMTFNICAKYIRSDEDRNECQKELIRAVRGGHMPGLPAQSTASSEDEFGRLIYQDEEQGIDSIPA